METVREKDLREATFSEIELLLNQLDYDNQTMLSSFVASICDVDVADMLSSTSSNYIAQCRWLFWYAYRYMTGESYDRIAERTIVDGFRFTKDTVCKGINKMSRILDAAQPDPQQQTWLHRWMIVKKFIKTKKDPHDYYLSDFTNPLPEKYKMTLRVPKGMKKSIEMEIKEF